MYDILYVRYDFFFFFFSSRRRHTRFDCDWSSDVCSSDLLPAEGERHRQQPLARRTRLGGILVREASPRLRRRRRALPAHRDRKSTRLNSSHSQISYAVFCLKKKNKNKINNVYLAHYLSIN